MNKITLYSKNNCMRCKMTKRFLDEHNIEFNEINISKTPEYIDYLKEKGFQATPVIEVENGTSFSGFQPDKLNQL